MGTCPVVNRRWAAQRPPEGAAELVVTYGLRPLVDLSSVVAVSKLPDGNCVVEIARVSPSIGDDGESR